MASKGRPKTPVVLSDEERETLRRWVNRGKTTHALATRARIVLRAAEDAQNKVVAGELGVSANMVVKWRKRFLESRLDGLMDEPRCGAPRKYGDDDIEAVIVATLEAKPKNATHWSNRSMAEHSGMSRETVGRIWRTFGLKPHRTETFKLSNDPQFIEKVRDIVGLYLNPPEHAIVLCIDEKSQTQALERAQPIFPILPGTPERRSHDYMRHGTTSLFAALNVGTGEVIGACHRRHRSIEFRKFLDRVAKAVPDDVEIHVICDNYSTHKTATIQSWLKRHPNFTFHFTPTSGSWLNMVERWFGELTEKLLRRSSHQNVQTLERDIRKWIGTWNENPRPYVWTKTADEILESLKRYCQRIDVSGH